MDPRPTSSPAEATRGDVVVLAPGKVVRLSAMVDAIVDELHEECFDPAVRERVRQMYHDALVEVGSTLSDPLLSELAHLQRSTGAASDDDLRIIVVQLAGWLRGLCNGMAAGDVTIVLPAVEGDLEDLLEDD